MVVFFFFFELVSVVCCPRWEGSKGEGQSSRKVSVSIEERKGDRRGSPLLPPSFFLSPLFLLCLSPSRTSVRLPAHPAGKQQLPAAPTASSLSSFPIPHSPFESKALSRGGMSRLLLVSCSLVPASLSSSPPFSLNSYIRDSFWI